MAQAAQHVQGRSWKVFVVVLWVLFFVLLFGVVLWWGWPQGMPPSIESLTISTVVDGPPVSDIALQEGATAHVVLYGVVRSEKGCARLMSSKVGIEARLYYSVAPCETPKDQHSASCYQKLSNAEAPGCRIFDCGKTNALEAKYACTMPLPFFATSTDAGSAQPDTFWIAGVRGRTEDGAKGAERTAIAEVLTLTAIEVPSALIYGDIVEGEVSSNVALPIRNMGNNHTAKIAVAGTDFTCSEGRAHVASLRYGVSPEQPYLQRTALLKDFVVVPLRVPVQMEEAHQIQELLHWQVMAPLGKGSDCTNRITIQVAP